MKLPLRGSRPRADVPLVVHVHPLPSRTSQPEFLRATRESITSQSAESDTGGSRKRAILLGVTGALCALGIAVALGVPSSPTVTPLPDESPMMTFAAPVVESSSPSDPRAFVIAEALAGHLGESVSRMSDLSASVTSRNGDVVLVEVRGINESGENRISALVVRASDGWVVRETYDASV